MSEHLKEKKETVLQYNVFTKEIETAERHVMELKNARKNLIKKLSFYYQVEEEDHSDTFFIDKVVWELGQEALKDGK